MSERLMPGAAEPVELALAVRGGPEKEQRQAAAGLLANLAQYPFDHNLELDWWEVINRPGFIPLFPGCRHLLLHPPLTPNGLDHVADPDGAVKLLYVVPITPLERHLLVEHGRESYQRHVAEGGVDLLADRSDPPGAFENP
jgi:hypothetical protein